MQLCLTSDAVQQLALPPMSPHNESRYATPFTVSIEARHGVTTGVSAQDRVTTIKAAIADNVHAEDLVRPGHVFPLRARDDGVLGRQGHTEGAIELAKMAGMRPAAVLCELMNADGTMMKGQDIHAFAAQHAFPIVTIEELVSIRRQLMAEEAPMVG